MLRLFVALELPEEVRVRLAALARPLPRATWISMASLHLTLCFIGEVDEGLAADIDAELARISLPAFELSLSGLGLFDSRDRVRALWAGVLPAPALTVLQARVVQAVKRAGAEPEARRFHPHVTLARLRNAPLEEVTPFVARHSFFKDGPFAVGAFVLMSSRLGHDGSVYTVERSYPLAGGDFAALAAEWEGG